MMNVFHKSQPMYKSELLLYATIIETELSTTENFIIYLHHSHKPEQLFADAIVLYSSVIA